MGVGRTSTVWETLGAAADAAFAAGLFFDWNEINSTSNVRTALAGMTGGYPLAPVGLRSTR